MGEKQAGDAKREYVLGGRLYLSKSGWVLLSVPNAILRGAFEAMVEPGVELPTNDIGQLNAHITVMSPEDVVDIGGADILTERGSEFNYSLGLVKSVRPNTWSGVGKAWFISIHSPALEKLRRSYGLSSKPHNGEYEFHCTFAIRKVGVLNKNEISKAPVKEKSQDIFGEGSRLITSDGVEKLSVDPAYLLQQAAIGSVFLS